MHATYTIMYNIITLYEHVYMHNSSFVSGSLNLCDPDFRRDLKTKVLPQLIKYSFEPFYESAFLG